MNFYQQSAAPQKVPPGARAPPPCYATVYVPPGMVS